MIQASEFQSTRFHRVTRPLGGRTLARVFAMGMGVTGVVVAVLVAAGAFASDGDRGVTGGTAPAVDAIRQEQAAKGEVQADVANEQVNPGVGDTGATGVVAQVEPIPGTGEQPTAVSATAESPAQVASSWSSTPVFDPPAPAPALTAGAVALAADVEARLGIDIVLDGQDWGADEAEQTANIGAVASAFQMLPVTVTSSVVSGPQGTLTVLSNREGRTLDGWKPYGGEPRTFYTNSDQGPDGYRAANEIVLTTGSDAMTVAHELLHAWTFRDVAADDYVMALLGDEVRSFMAAAGWEQLATDDDVRASTREQWETVNGLFAYIGPELTYVDQHGNQTALKADNPLEALALTGAIYYARPAGMALPDWAPIWAWFDAAFV